MEETKEQHVLMFSGGLDSYLALLVLLDKGIKPKLVYSRHRSKNDDRQLRQVKRLANLHKLELEVDNTLNLQQWEDEETAFIPNRNGFLAFVGSLYGNRVWFAIMDGEQQYTDCRRDTFLTLSLALTKLKGEMVVVDSPFWNLTKAEVIDSLHENNKVKILNTYSCHKGGQEHCGSCSACFRRAVAFAVNNLKDEFKENPFKTKLAEEYKKKAEKGHYGKRDEEILLAFKKAGELYDG